MRDLLATIHRTRFEQVFASGQCGCQGYDLTQGDDYETIFDTMADMTDIIGGFDSDIKRQVVAILW